MDSYVINVAATHRVWRDFDDDDWGGMALGQWFRRIPCGTVVRLTPPPLVTPSLLYAIVIAFVRRGARVVAS